MNPLVFVDATFCFVSFFQSLCHAHAKHKCVTINQNDSKVMDTNTQMTFEMNNCSLWWHGTAITHIRMILISNSHSRHHKTATGTHPPKLLVYRSRFINTNDITVVWDHAFSEIEVKKLKKSMEKEN